MLAPSPVLSLAKPAVGTGGGAYPNMGAGVGGRSLFSPSAARAQAFAPEANQERYASHASQQAFGKNEALLVATLLGGAPHFPESGYSARVVEV